MSTVKVTHFFDPQACDRCGRCLRECPVLELPEKRAVCEFAKLVSGPPDRSLAFRRCTTCNACNLVCPSGALPYELILERFGEWGEKHGLPFFAKMVLPNEPVNMWSSLRRITDESDLTTWEKRLEEKREEIFLTGFYTNIVPFLMRLGPVDRLRQCMVGSERLWGCGADTYKLGLFGLTGEIARMVGEKLSQMGVRRVICSMESEAAMLAEVLPRRFGADFAVEVVTLDDWLLGEIESGRMKIKTELGMKVTVHDNCLSRYFGGKPQEVLRRLVTLSGCRIVEMRHNRARALCCGWGATIPKLYGKGSGNPVAIVLYLLDSLYRRMEEARATGAKAIVVSCPACYLFLSLIKNLTMSRIQVYHVLEILEMAGGKAVDRAIDQRCWDILSISAEMVYLWISSRANRSRFFPKPVSAVAPLPAVPESSARRMKFTARLFKGPLLQNRLTKSILACAVKLTVLGYRALRR